MLNSKKDSLKRAFCVTFSLKACLKHFAKVDSWCCNSFFWICNYSLKIKEWVLQNPKVLRAGFEPANPCGKGFPIRAPSQSVDLESLVEHARWRILSPLTWLGYRSIMQLKMSVSFLINHLPLTVSLHDFFQFNDEAFENL